MSISPAILYVEDEPMSRMVMDLLLKGRMGLDNVTIFEDSHNFMGRLNSLSPQPEVIFLDIHMEPIDGFEMLELVRNADHLQTTPVVALTASVMNEEIARLKSAGFDGCLAKPIDLETFPDTLQQIISGNSVWQIVT